MPTTESELASPTWKVTLIDLLGIHLQDGIYQVIRKPTRTAARPSPTLTPTLTWDSSQSTTVILRLILIDTYWVKTSAMEQMNRSKPILTSAHFPQRTRRDWGGQLPEGPPARVHSLPGGVQGGRHPRGDTQVISGRGLRTQNLRQRHGIDRKHRWLYGNIITQGF